MNKKIVLMLLFTTINATEHIKSHINVDLSKIYYSTKIVGKKKQLEVIKFFKSPIHISDEIVLQNILAVAKAQAVNRIEIPRVVIQKPVQYLCSPILDQAKITVRDPAWDYTLVAYTTNDCSFARKLCLNKEQEYFKAIIQNSDYLMYRIFAVDKNKEIIGGCKLLYHHLYKNYAELDHIYVCSQDRNKHIGSSLLSLCKELSAARKKDTIKLFAFPFGESAMDQKTLKNWYMKQEFANPAGQQPNMIADTTTVVPSNTQIVTLELYNNNILYN